MSWGPFRAGLTSLAGGGVASSSTAGDGDADFTSDAVVVYVSSISSLVSVGECPNGGLWLSSLLSGSGLMVVRDGVGSSAARTGDIYRTALQLSLRCSRAINDNQWNN